MSSEKTVAPEPTRTAPVLRDMLNGPSGALIGLYRVVLAVSVVAALYFARELLVPLALAGLLTFVLAPLVTRIERGTGRVAAISAVTSLVFVLLAGLSWALTRQVSDLVNQLPDYRTNIERKLHALEISRDSGIKRFSSMIGDLASELPLLDTRPAAAPDQVGPASAPVAAAKPGAPAPVDPFGKLPLLIGPFFHALATGGVVILVTIFMLLKREDLRGRLIKIAGQGRIGSSSRLIEDAASRISRYLISQLVVNTIFGCTIALGLYFVGVPNAFLWGVMATGLRFIPYVGAWLAAICPIVIALAVSPDWQMAILTLGLFALLELVTANFLEPLVYGSSTGVSSLALIVAALFWAWLWGPIGLLLSTPLTVCLAVLGRHVPRLAFFSILLGSEEALSPAEDCYHRLLAEGLGEAETIIEAYVKENSLTALFDEVLIPVITYAEMDFHRGEIEESQRLRVLQGIRDILEDLTSRPPPPKEADRAGTSEPSDEIGRTDCRVICVSTRSERDEISGLMLAHRLRLQGFAAIALEPRVTATQLSATLDEFRADAICISMVPPTSMTHVRLLCARIRGRHKNLRIMVGIWGATENLEDALRGLRVAGVDEVVTSFAEAEVKFARISGHLQEQATPAQIPSDDDERVDTLQGLPAYQEGSNPVFDRITRKLADTFAVPIALATFIDRDRQHFKASVGLPAEMASVAEIPRKDSICTHVVAHNAPLVVEDLARDRRFARNSLLQGLKLRFYAGVPIRAPNGQPVGALCLLDTKPRTFSAAELRLLEGFGAEASASLREVPATSGLEPIG